MEEFTCPKCGSHEHCDFAGTKGRLIMLCRTCSNAPKIRKNYKCPICGERGHYRKFHNEFLCKRCGSKEFEVYADKFGRHRRCVSCLRARAKESYRRNYKPHPKVRHDQRELREKRRAQKLEEVLNGKHLECAICHKQLEANGNGNHKNEIAHIDHDHKTGKNRGILCMFCNCGIGNFRDSEILLKAAIKYLKNN